MLIILYQLVAIEFQRRDRLMSTAAFENMRSNTTFNSSIRNLDDAREWIGRRLTLRKNLLAFKPGRRCIVMCVVDFGDGPLLWIVTDDKHAIEVDQMELSCVANYFNLLQPDDLNQAG